MAVDGGRVRAIALALHDASEAAHFDRVAFRTPRKIFATLGSGDLNLMFDPDLRDHFCERDPAVFAPVAGGWGRRGATRCDLQRADEEILTAALQAAHALAGPLPKRR